MKKTLLALVFAVGILTLNAQFYGGVKTGVQKNKPPSIRHSPRS